MADSALGVRNPLNRSVGIDNKGARRRLADTKSMPSRHKATRASKANPPRSLVRDPWSAYSHLAIISNHRAYAVGASESTGNLDSGLVQIIYKQEFLPRLVEYREPLAIRASLLASTEPSYASRIRLYIFGPPSRPEVE
jgi:hypothetical protein